MASSSVAAPATPTTHAVVTEVNRTVPASSTSRTPDAGTCPVEDVDDFVHVDADVSMNVDVGNVTASASTTANLDTMTAVLDIDEVYTSRASVTDHFLLLSASRHEHPAPPSKPSYGLDSPLGLALSNVAAPMYLYASLKGKLDAWDALLEELSRGAERMEVFARPTLDVGCGRGLVLLKIAMWKKRLHHSDADAKDSKAGSKRRISKAYAIDLFRRGDQSGNSPLATFQNAACLRIEDQVALLSADFTQRFPFRDNVFGLVTASLALHNVKPHGREKAVEEMARTCRPGGRLILLDLYGYVRGYETTLRRLGWKEVKIEFGGMRVMFGGWPCQVLKARKPATVMPAMVIPAEGT